MIGVPVAWILWYYRLYNAAKKDAAFTYAWFFLAYLVHIFWCIWSAVCAFPPLLRPRHSCVILRQSRVAVLQCAALFLLVSSSLRTGTR